MELSEDTRRIIGNFFSLSLLECANYILPLITLPYLVRVLGPSNFGKVAFAQAFVQYFVITTDYGFYLLGPKKISINREKLSAVSKIFSSIMVIKTILFFLSFLVLLSLILVITKFGIEKPIFIFSFGLVLGDVLFPTWFFQGMERMKYITVLYFVAKLFFLVTIFIFIRSKNQYIYVPLLQSLGIIFAGILSLLIIRFKFNVRFKIPPFVRIKEYLKEGWHFFISTLSISVYTYSNTFILGLLTTPVIVGYYSAAEKIIRALQRMQWAVSQAVYPYVNKIASQSEKKALRFLKKLIVFVGGGFLLISLTIFIFAKLIVNLILGDQYIPSIIVLQILAFLPFIISISNIFGVQTMLAFNMKEDFSKIMLSTALVNIVLASVLASMYKHIGVSIAVVLTEIYVALIMCFYLRKHGISYLELIHS
ncbi:MAG TPA: flippase [candidate division WOR-3 bacterium]|uniref:Flippase n=1 Tax=candidate division WOR-3 bacterium TaxID=2052148 RepID=A0A9C9EMF4_UNCW3|nr:flippase [candidate division WOR-3 bacterium]